MSINRALRRRAEAEIVSYVFATILKPGPNKSRRPSKWRAWFAAAVLILTVVLALAEVL